MPPRREARGHARSVLPEWRLAGCEEAVLAVVSELIANTVAATSRAGWEAGLPPVPLWLLGGAPGVIVLVRDAAAEVSEPRVADVWDESGRGLAIVACYSAQWDHCRPAAPFGGKVTRASSPPHAPP